MADATLPEKYCDIVMKGGVTSGVVYPLAAVALAKQYTFKNVGGTSAGAIAAAATAAAEFRRRTGSIAGFDALERLPQTLGKPGFLLSLFEPDPPTKPLFQALLSIADSKSPVAAAARFWSALIRGYLWSAIAGAALGSAVPIALWKAGYVRGEAAFALGALWVLVGMTIAALIAAASSLPRLLRRNRFGLCSGFRRGAPIGEAPLVTWLYGYLNEVAGLETSEPLTFRHLHDAPVGNDVTGAPRTINLEMMTTNLTHGRPHRLPFPIEEGRQFFFAPAEWEDLFPPVVIAHLLNHADAGVRTPANDENLALYPLPITDLPIVVAVRMSLSFPGLFTAVPLWAVDYTLKKNQHLPPNVAGTAERCWFADGGLCSNFPIHFFDAPLPRWPTFGVNLKPPHPDFQEEKDFVWLPTSNGGGLQPRWNRFDRGSDTQQIGGFVGALIDSMQAWRDNLDARMPGYRNRIVHVSQTSEEGGLTLSMPPEAIARLSDRGRRAGELLRTQFDFENHVWVRYRSYVAGLWESLRAFAETYSHPVPQDHAAWPFITGSAPPPPFPSYPLSARDARELADLTRHVVDAVEAAPSEMFVDGAPRPRPELRLVPKV